MQQLTIVGDRQSGRSTALIDMAINEARQGGTVWFQCADRSLVSVRLADTQDRAQELAPQMISRVYKTNGDERITFTSGGVIDFGSHSRGDIALHCMDDVLCEPCLRAKRAVRAVLR